MKDAFADPIDVAIAAQRLALLQGGSAAAPGRARRAASAPEEELRRQVGLLKPGPRQPVAGPVHVRVRMRAWSSATISIGACTGSMRQIVRPGCALRHELARRRPNVLAGMIATAIAGSSSLRFAEGKAFTTRTGRPIDRIVETTHQPIAGGGWVSTHQDITKRRRAEMALRKNEHVLQSTFDHMAEGISIFDADLNLVAANRRYRELLGIPEALSRPGTPLAEILRHRAGRGDYGACDVEEQVRTRLELARNADHQLIEAELPDGTIVELRATALPEGGFVRICTDVTERATAARELRAAHARLREAFDIVPEGLALFDAEGRYALWNKRYEAIYAESMDIIKVGARFEDVLRRGLARGQYREAIGREDAWLVERLAALGRSQ